MLKFYDRISTHGAMDHQIDTSWWIDCSVSHSSQCSMTEWCYPVCGMVHIKDPLLLIGKSDPCSGDSGFPLSLSKWSYTICLMPYNRIGLLPVCRSTSFI